MSMFDRKQVLIAAGLIALLEIMSVVLLRAAG
jgi:hypothetical protein